MSGTLESIKSLAVAGNVRVSEHGYDELAEDHVAPRDIIVGVANAVVVEDYPEFPKGPAVLVLQYDHTNEPIHVVWGIPRGPAQRCSCYRPDPRRWSEDFLERRDE